MDYKRLLNDIEECETGDCYIIEQLKSYIESFCEDCNIEKDTHEWFLIVDKAWSYMSELKYEHFSDIQDFIDYLD